LLYIDLSRFEQRVQGIIRFMLLIRIGLISIFTGSASLIGIPLSAACILPGTWDHSFGPMILVSGLFITVGAGFYGVTRVKMMGWKLSDKR
jgi:hypothetical protein